MIPGTAFLAPSPEPRGRSLAYGATFVLLAALTASVAFIPHVEFVALSALYLGALLAYLGLRSDPQGGHLFEVIVLLGVLSFLYFCAGTMYILIVPEGLERPALIPFLLPALALATLGFLSLLVGYGWSFRKTAPSPLGRFVPTSVFVYLIPGTLGMLGMSAQRYQTEGVLNSEGISPALSFLQQFAALFFFAWFLAWYMTWARRLRPSIAVPTLVTLSAMTALVLYFTFGGKGLALTLLGMPAMAYYEVKRKVPIKSVLVVVLLFVFIIYPVYNTYRTLDKDLAMSRRVDRTVDMARTWSSDKYLDASVFAFLKRITIVTSVAAIVSDTGRWVDYRYGETLILGPIGLLIPRFLWPDKPNISIGQEFGETFRLKNAMDAETYIAPSMVGDLYWNFSVPGVVVGMWLIGMAYRWYYQRFGAGAGFDPIRKSIYFTVLPTVLSFEGNVAIVLAGVVKVLVILVVFLLLCRRLGWLEEPLSG
jgi:uncharacterized membrane protein